MVDEVRRMAGGSPVGKRKGDESDKSAKKKTETLRELQLNDDPETEENGDSEGESGSEGIISIYVKTLTEETISLKVRPKDTIGDVKVMIWVKKGIPIDQQALIFNKVVLDDADTIGDFDIHNDSTLKIMLKSNGFRRIFIKIHKRTTISLEVKPLDTIGHVKAKIWDKEGILPDEQALIFNEMFLEDSSTLVDFNIRKDSTLKLMFKSRGFMMKIYVKSPTTRTISLLVKPTDTVSKVKNKIKFLVSIPCDEQVLIFNERVLDDSNTLSDFHVNRESILTLMRKLKGFMEISVKPVTGMTITLDVKPSDTVYDLKAMISEKEGYPISNLRLIFSGRTLEGGRSLADYNIREGSTLFLVIRLSVSCTFENHKYGEGENLRETDMNTHEICSFMEFTHTVGYFYVASIFAPAKFSSY